jgi:hypothetical protein
MKISEEPMRAVGVYAFTRGSVEKETRRHIRDLTGQLSRLRSEAPRCSMHGRRAYAT